MTIEEQICRNAIRQPASIALITPEEQVTYAQLWERCLLAATNVRRKYGLQKGDRIILAASCRVMPKLSIFFMNSSTACRASCT